MLTSQCLNTSEMYYNASVTLPKYRHNIHHTPTRQLSTAKKVHNNIQQTKTLLRYYRLQRRNISSLLLDPSFIILEHWMEPCSCTQ